MVLSQKILCNRIIVLHIPNGRYGDMMQSKCLEISSPPIFNQMAAWMSMESTQSSVSVEFSREVLSNDRTQQHLMHFTFMTRFDAV